MSVSMTSSESDIFARKDEVKAMLHKNRILEMMSDYSPFKLKYRLKEKCQIFFILHALSYY